MQLIVTLSDEVYEYINEASQLEEIMHFELCEIILTKWVREQEQEDEDDTSD